MALQDAHILVVDDDPNVLLAADIWLSQYFSNVSTLDQPSKVLNHLQAFPANLVLLDMNYRKGQMDGKDGLQLLERVLSRYPHIQIIPMTAYAEIDLAVEAVKKGAFDFITKPWENQKLLSTVQAALQLHKSKKEVQVLKKSRNAYREALGNHSTPFISVSKVMEQLKAQIAQVAPTDAHVLITGENGVGKEVVAKALHHASLRNDKAFVQVDLGAIPASLFESELFGAKKGAFTDAKTDKTGRFVLAHKGTLFLDEIGNLPLEAQPKLLGALQRKCITPLGGDKELQVDVRVVAATNTQLTAAVAEGRFRQDLYYRLNTVELHIPPLRERRDDILPLSKHFIAELAAKYQKDPVVLGEKAAERLYDYHWPGNVRELQHCLERAIILLEGRNLHPDDFVLGQTQHVAVTTHQHGNLQLAAVEKAAVAQALQKHKGNVSRAAKTLGITRAALYRRMEKHGL